MAWWLRHFPEIPKNPGSIPQVSHKATWSLFEAARGPGITILALCLQINKKNKIKVKHKLSTSIHHSLLPNFGDM